MDIFHRLMGSVLPPYVVGYHRESVIFHRVLAQYHRLYDIFHRVLQNTINFTKLLPGK